MKEPTASTDSGWDQAVRLCESVQRRPDKADTLLDRLCVHISTEERKRCQSLFFGVLRNRRLLRAAYESLIRKKTRPLFRAACDVATFELLEAPAKKWPKIVHHAVSRAKSTLSVAESGALNAILRRAQANLSQLLEDAPAPIRLSHPDWLAQRWTDQFGADKAIALMQWNQKPPPIYGRWRAAAPQPEFLKATLWSGFFEIPGEHWQALSRDLKKGRFFVQDPSTRLAADLLAVQPGESVLDLCAAPGGKSLLLADALGDDTSGRLVCVDKPGDRAGLLDENLSKLNTGAGPELQLLQGDILEIKAEDLGHFDAVLLDAPCSNTGVLRRRPDLRWRLQPETPAESAATQLKLLCKAAHWVRSGGRLAYSTCSLEPEENEGVVKTFLEMHPDFKLDHVLLSMPYESGHDGAGIHLLRRR